jgi:hypothetical protein
VFSSPFLYVYAELLPESERESERERERETLFAHSSLRKNPSP